MMAVSELWPAPLTTRPIDARLSLPGSKSITNRALVLAALADSPSAITGALIARDTELMIEALRALGVVIDVSGTTLHVTPQPLRGPASIEVGNAGTVMRFLLPVAALGDGPVRFDGDPRARERPLGPVIDALRALGVEIDHGGRRALPLTVFGRGAVGGGEVEIDASASSQFVSALLLAAPRFNRPLTVRHVGPPVPSRPHIDMTLAMLRDRGVEVDGGEPDRWTVAPRRFAGFGLEVEPDLSNAAPFLAAAVATGGSVTIEGWPRASTQPGMHLPGVLERMGASVQRVDGGLMVAGPQHIAPIDIDLHELGELTPVLAALCALAGGQSRLSGIAHLRLHETDRLAALARELIALGANVVETADGLVIDGAPLHGAVFRTYDDHRLATAAAVLGLVTPGVMVENIATVGKTLPEFVALWRTMLEGR